MNHKTEKTLHKKPFKKYTKNRSQNVKIVPQKVLDRTNGTRATLIAKKQSLKVLDRTNGTRATLIAKKQSLRENFRTSVNIFLEVEWGVGLVKK